MYKYDFYVIMGVQKGRRASTDKKKRCLRYKTSAEKRKVNIFLPKKYTLKLRHDKARKHAQSLKRRGLIFTTNSFSTSREIWVSRIIDL